MKVLVIYLILVLSSNAFSEDCARLENLSQNILNTSRVFNTYHEQIDTLSEDVKRYVRTYIKANLKRHYSLSIILLSRLSPDSESCFDIKNTITHDLELLQDQIDKRGF